jgi:eukaryotic-like serine/threonine-protein kinase
MLSIALAYIGSKNVVHRDIKPANILISTIGEKRVYKLTDFGIAQNDYDNKL